MPEAADAELTALAATVRALRERRDISPEQLADDAGVPREEVAALESATADPSFQTLVQLSRALGVPLSELADGVESRLAQGPA